MNDDMMASLAERVRTQRMLRGMTQHDLAERAGVSRRTIERVEQAQEQVRLATVHKIAKGLQLRTSDLLQRGKAEPGDPLRGEPWDDARAAFYKPRPGAAEPSVASVLASLRAMIPDLAANRYDQARVMLPSLLTEADGLDGTDGMRARSRVWNTTAWLLTMSRQWEDADVVTRRAIDAAQDPDDAMAAVSTRCWGLLRQGRLAEAEELAVGWADRMEPRSFSRASDESLANWGHLWLYVSNARVRDNQPGAAAEALRNAGAAAAKIGRQITTDKSTTRTFGPTSIKFIAAECAVLTDKPDRTLAIAAAVTPADLHGVQSNTVLRHMLDVAAAHAARKQWGDAVDVLDGVRREAPQWLAYQGAARDVAERVLHSRRKLTPQMREVAGAVRISL